MSDYKIIQDNNNKTIFKIEFAYPNPILINSLIKTRLIQGATATDDYKTIKFKAVSVTNFTNFTNFTKKNSNKNKIPIPITANIVATLSTQLKYLIQHNYTFLGYNLENIIVINDQIFVNLDNELLIDIVENDMALISSPFSTADFFAAPELLTITELPSYVHYKVAYFSMAKLILNMEDTDKSLIKGTKLYHLLSRCLNENPKTRNILFI
jgi:hypothetical protein